MNESMPIRLKAVHLTPGGITLDQCLNSSNWTPHGVYLVELSLIARSECTEQGRGGFHPVRMIGTIRAAPDARTGYGGV